MVIGMDSYHDSKRKGEFCRLSKDGNHIVVQVLVSVHLLHQQMSLVLDSILE